MFAKHTAECIARGATRALLGDTNNHSCYELEPDASAPARRAIDTEAVPRDPEPDLLDRFAELLGLRVI